jgi:acyl-CoA oxidase
MPTNPEWVKALKPATDGGELLRKERAKSDLPVDNVSKFMFGEEFLETRRKILEILQSEKVFDKSQNYFTGRIARFEAALARAKRLRLLAAEHDWSLEDHNIAVDLLSEPTPYMLHGTMFLVRATCQTNDDNT